MKLHQIVHRWLVDNVATQHWHYGVKTQRPDVKIYAADTVDPFLNRWVLIPRNLLVSAYLHRFDMSDPIPHDHPYTFNASWLLDGTYTEHYPAGGFDVRVAGNFILRFGKAAHSVKLVPNVRIQDPPYKQVWSIFITGPRFRVWGFYCPNGWVPWNKAVKTDDPKKFAKNPTPPVCP